MSRLRRWVARWLVGWAETVVSYRYGLPPEDAHRLIGGPR